MPDLRFFGSAAAPLTGAGCSAPGTSSKRNDRVQMVITAPGVSSTGWSPTQVSDSAELSLALILTLVGSLLMLAMVARFWALTVTLA